jgi:hypothetical protein
MSVPPNPEGPRMGIAMQLMISIFLHVPFMFIFQHNILFRYFTSRTMSRAMNHKLRFRQWEKA